MQAAQWTENLLRRAAGGIRNVSFLENMSPEKQHFRMISRLGTQGPAHTIKFDKVELLVMGVDRIFYELIQS
nr:unnamed protein product [Spirometra erinaceieuropaei]